MGSGFHFSMPLPLVSHASGAGDLRPSEQCGLTVNATLESTDLYFSLTPKRFRKDPQRGRKHRRDDPALMKCLDISSPHARRTFHSATFTRHIMCYQQRQKSNLDRFFELGIGSSQVTNSMRQKCTKLALSAPAN